jgi:hypothetical protein
VRVQLCIVLHFAHLFRSEAAWRVCPKACLLLVGLQFLVAVLHLIAAEVSSAPLRLVRCVALQLPAWTPLLAGALLGETAELWCLPVALAAQAGCAALCWAGLLRPLCRALQMPHFWSIPPKARALLQAQRDLQ